MTNEQMEKEIAKVATMESAGNLSFMKKEFTDPVLIDKRFDKTNLSMRETILIRAQQIATNEREALYGDQTELNQFIAKIHNLMVEHRPSRMKDGEFTQWISNAFDFGRLFKSPVYNSEPYTSFAAGIGIAAECASKEDQR